MNKSLERTTREQIVSTLITYRATTLRWNSSPGSRSRLKSNLIKFIMSCL